MSIALLAVALAGLVGMVSSGPNTPARDQDPDIASGGAGFSRFLEYVTLLGVLVMALVILAGILSFFGVFEKDLIDPPV